MDRSGYQRYRAGGYDESCITRLVNIIYIYILVICKCLYSTLPRTPLRRYPEHFSAYFCYDNNQIYYFISFCKSNRSYFFNFHQIKYLLNHRYLNFAINFNSQRIRVLKFVAESCGVISLPMQKAS